MKKIIFVIMLLVSGIFGCYYDEEIIVGEITDYDFENDIEINSIDNAIDYVFSNITYKDDKSDYLQTPEETYNLKTGNWSDIAIFLCFLLESKLNYQTDLTILEKTFLDNKSYSAFTHIPQEDIYINAVSYDTMTKAELLAQSLIWGPFLTKKIIYEIPYSELIWMAYTYHSFVGKYNNL